MTKFISFLFLDIDVSVKSVAEILCLGLFPVKKYQHSIRNDFCDLIGR